MVLNKFPSEFYWKHADIESPPQLRLKAVFLACRNPLFNPFNRHLVVPPFPARAGLPVERKIDLAAGREGFGGQIDMVKIPASAVGVAARVARVARVTPLADWWVLW